MAKNCKMRVGEIIDGKNKLGGKERREHANREKVERLPCISWKSIEHIV